MLRSKWLYAVSACSFLLAGCGSKSTVSNPKVIGGKISNRHHFLAGLVFGNDNEIGCGGSFVGPRLVVTAAHCAVDLTQSLRVRPGTDNTDPTKVPLIPVQAAIVHPHYNPVLMQNDVALLVLAPYDQASIPEPIETIALNDNDAFPKDDVTQAMTIIGRGNVSSFGSVFDDVVREADLHVIPLQDCAKAYTDGSITAGVICAGDLAKGGVDTCQGDSGGPMVASDNGLLKLVGIVSWGEGCAQAHKPGVYTRVSTQHAWLQEQIALWNGSVPNPTPEQLRYFVNAFCYDKKAFRDVTSLGSGDHHGNVADIYGLANGLEPNPGTTDDLTSICHLQLPGGLALTAQLSHPGPAAKVVVQGTGQEWSANAQVASTELNLDCDDNGVKLRFNSVGVSMMAFGSEQYDFMASDDQLLEQSSVVTSCQADSYSVEVLRKSVNGGEQLFARVKGPKFGHGQVYKLSESSEGGSIEATMKHVEESVPSHTDNSTWSLTLGNPTGTDIFTWELGCNFAYRLTDDFGVVYTAEKRGSDRYVYRFTSPAHIQGNFLQGETKTFAVALPNGLGNHPTCDVNGDAIKLHVEP